MIQELLGGGSGLLGERKIPINGGILQGTPCSSPPPSLSSSYPSTTVAGAAGAATTTSTATTSPTTSTKTSSTNSESQNLRCPRCDSTNTKFCYYNNYNLTQPRHFCKTCRRYWTKGGALRNVPIGGGCRKNKNVTVSSPVAKSSVGKLKTLPPEFGRSGLGGGGFDHEISSNGIFWASPQNSHILALLRSTQSPNPNPNPMSSNPASLKEEVGVIGSQLIGEQTVSNGALNARTLGLDPLGQVPSLSLWGNNHAQQQNGVILGEIQNSGLPELYQRLKASTNYSNDQSQQMGNLVSSSSSSTSILESAPVGAGELSYWNPAFSWADLQTANGAYP